MYNKIIESLKSSLPAEMLKEVVPAVENMVESVKKELTEEFNEQLKVAYSELSAEKEESERIALEGYQEAYALINDLRNRMELMKEEYEQELNDGFQEAYQMIKSERSKANSLSTKVYDEYDTKLEQMQEFIVDKLHEFLHEKGGEIYEQAKRDVLNDPTFAEHKVAMDKITNIVSRHVSDEDKFLATGSRLEEATRQIEELKSQVKMMEGRNIKLSYDNTALNERVREFKNVLTESKLNERKSRKSQQVFGKGHRHFNEEKVEIITENNSPKRNAQRDRNDAKNMLIENLNIDKKTLNLLAGNIKSDK